MGYWAAISVGAACVGMNAWWTPHEMEYALDDSHPRVLIVDDERLERVSHILEAVRVRLPKPMHVITVRSDRELPPNATRWSDVMADGRSRHAARGGDRPRRRRRRSSTRPAPPASPRAPSSPTAARVHNLLNLMYMATAVTSAEAKAIAAGEVEAPAAPAAPLPPVFMAPTPLFHVTACNCLLHPATATGGRDRAHLQVGRRRGAGAHRARAGHELLRRADDGTRTAHAPRLGHARHVVAGEHQRRRRGRAARPRAEDRQCAGEGLAHHRLRHDRDPRDHHRQLVAVLPRQAVVVRPRRADPRRQARRRGRQRPSAHPDTVGVLCVRGTHRHQGLHQPPRGHGGLHPGRLAEHRRHRPHRRGRLGVHRRPRQGHGDPRRRERLLQRGRGGHLPPRRRRRSASSSACPTTASARRSRHASCPRTDRPSRSRSYRRSCRTDLSAYKIPSKIWFRTEPIPRNASGKFLKRDVRKEILEGS